MVSVAVCSLSDYPNVVDCIDCSKRACYLADLGQNPKCGWFGPAQHGNGQALGSVVMICSAMGAVSLTSRTPPYQARQGSQASIQYSRACSSKQCDQWLCKAMSLRSFVTCELYGLHPPCHLHSRFLPLHPQPYCRRSCASHHLP